MSPQSELCRSPFDAARELLVAETHGDTPRTREEGARSGCILRARAEDQPHDAQPSVAAVASMVAGGERMAMCSIAIAGAQPTVRQARLAAVAGERVYIVEW